MLKTKIQSSLKESTSYRVKTRIGTEKKYTYINYEVDSSENQHLMFSDSKTDSKLNAIIWLNGKVFYNEKEMDKFNDKEPVWTNEIPVKLNYQSYIDSAKNALYIFNQNFTDCHFIKEKKYITATFKIYLLTLQKDTFKVWLNTTTNKVDRIIEIFGEKNRFWFFNNPFNIAKPEISKNKRNFLGLYFFPPAYNSDEDIEGTDFVYEMVDVQPKFKNGEKDLFKFLASTIQYPMESRRDRFEGTVYIGFVIEKDGSVSNVRIKRGVSPPLDAETMRVIRLMNKKWTPAKYKGENVRVAYTVPVKYKLDY